MKKTYNGLLVVNEFLHANKYSELYDWFLNAAIKLGVHLSVVSNAVLCTASIEEKLKEEEIDFVLFWDKDIRLAMYLEQLSIPVFNSAKAIEICDDKSYTYLTLKQANLPMPKTILGPKTYENVNYTTYEFLEQIQQQLGYPMVVKECFGSFGQQVYLIHDFSQLKACVDQTAPKPLIFQEYIASSFAKDVRVQVVGGEVVASMYRYSETGDFRANISNGGKMKNYEPSLREQELAIKSCEAIGLDFAGVDLLFGEDGEYFVCEVNSNAHFRNIYECTKVNCAEKILQHIVSSLDKNRR